MDHIDQELGYGMKLIYSYINQYEYTIHRLYREELSVLHEISESFGNIENFNEFWKETMQEIKHSLETERDLRPIIPTAASLLALAIYMSLPVEKHMLCVDALSEKMRDQLEIIHLRVAKESKKIS